MPVKNHNSIRKQIMAWALTTDRPFSRQQVIDALRAMGCTAAESSIKNSVSICVARGSLNVEIRQNGGRKKRVAMYWVRQGLWLEQLI
jgi:hypothetical protein